MTLSHFPFLGFNNRGQPINNKYSFLILIQHSQNSDITCLTCFNHCNFVTFFKVHVIFGHP